MKIMIYILYVFKRFRLICNVILVIHVIFIITMMIII